MYLKEYTVYLKEGTPKRNQVKIHKDISEGFNKGTLGVISEGIPEESRKEISDGVPEKKGIPHEVSDKQSWSCFFRYKSGRINE